MHLLTGELLTNTGVIAQIRLGADDQAGDTRAVVVDFGEPFFANVLKRGGRGDGEADEEDIRLRVGQRAQPVVVLLSSSIEEAERIRFIADPGFRFPSGGVLFSFSLGRGVVGNNLHHGHGVVVEHGGHIFRGELVGCVRDEKTGFADCTIPYHDTSGWAVS